VAAVNSNSGVSARNGTTTHTINFGFTSTAGNLLVFVVAGAVTHTNAGWNERLSPVSGAELSVFTKTSAGESSFTDTVNGSNYPVVWAVWEFPAGSTWVNGISGIPAAGTSGASRAWGSTLTGLPGTAVTVIAAAASANVGGGSVTFTGTWSAPYTSVVNLTAPASGTDGVGMAVGTTTGYTSTTTQPTWTPTWSAGLSGWASDIQQVLFAINEGGGAPSSPTVTAGTARPVLRGGAVGLDVTATPPGGQTISSHSWAITVGGGSLTNATTATPTYTAPGTGSGVVTIRDTVTASGGGTATADLTVSYHATIVAAENALTGTARATWDLASPNLGGVSTLQGFADGFSFNRTDTVNFKIGQSDSAGWAAEVFRLGWYNGDGARSYGTLTPSGGQVTTSQSQPTPGDADATTTLLSADAGNWTTSLTWTPPAWAPTGVYVLRLNRTGGGASHVMFILRDDARHADLALMPADSTWQAYNAWGGLAGGQYAGNSLYYGTAVDQYNADCARFVSYNRPIVNRGAADASRAYGAVEWSNFFTAEYPMLRFLERNGHDVKYMACIDAAGDPTGTHLTGNGTTRGGVGAAIAVGHNEYWSDGMRAGWETAKAAGVSLFFSAGNEVFWRVYGSDADAASRPRTLECQKSTIGGRGNTRPQWTGTWRDPDGAGKGGNAPENTLTGTIFAVNGPDLRALVVPFAGGYSAQPLWRHTSVAALGSGQYTSPAQILGFEWDVPGPAFVSTAAAGFMAAPHPQARYCSTVTYSVSSGLLLTDAGDEYLAAGTATHRLVVHPGGGSAIVFGTGTVNWALGLDNANTYQQGSDNTDAVLQQATINILADMGAPAATLMSGLTAPTPITWFSSSALTEAGTGTDTASVAASASLADAGSAAQTFAANAAVGLADTGAGGQTFTAAAAVGLAESATATELMTLAAAVGLIESAAAGESLSNGSGVSKPVADEGASAEGLTVTAVLGLSDTATAADQSVIAASVALADTASAVQSIGIAALAALADTAVSVQMVTALVTASLADAGSAADGALGQDNANVSRTLADSGSAGEFISFVHSLIEGEPIITGDESPARVT
jgi:hypothetical protein